MPDLCPLLASRERKDKAPAEPILLDCLDVQPPTAAFIESSVVHKVGHVPDILNPLQF